jgi:hypothetical protein
MRPSTRVLSEWKYHWRKKFSVWYQHKKRKISCLICTGRSFFTSAVITGVQMGEMSNLGWLIGWSIRDVNGLLVISCMCMVQSARSSLNSNIFLWRSSYACWANFDFSSRPWVRLYLCSLMRKGSHFNRLTRNSACEETNTKFLLLSLHSYYKNERMWHHIYFLLFTAVALNGHMVSKYEVDGVMF